MSTTSSSQEQTPLFSQQVGVIGSGSWGTALSLLLAQTQQEVLLWGHRSETIIKLRTNRLNNTYLPGIPLPTNILPTDSLEELAQASILLFVVPSLFLPNIAQKLAPFLRPHQHIIISCTKGLEYQKGKVMSELLEQELPNQEIGVLSGPNLALEIAQGLPAAGVLAAKNEIILPKLTPLFPQQRYRTYSSNDWRGVQLGGALKNIFAIAAGVADGLNVGSNAKAAIVNRSLAEMQRLGIALGGKGETFQGLSGLGDLMLTCYSPQSRNHRAGRELATGHKISNINPQSHMVVEGLSTAKSAQHAARKHQISTPIIDQVVALLKGETTASAAMQQLLSRPLTKELLP